MPKDFLPVGGQQWVFPGGGHKHFSRGANSGEILFYQLETKRKTFYC